MRTDLLNPDELLASDGAAATAPGRRGVGEVRGPRELPRGYAHPHASEEARRIAEDGLVLRAQVGSGVHGTAVSGQDDRDEMGICLEPREFVTGLARVPAGTSATSRRAEFEQYQRHTAWDRDGGLRNRSGAGDLDVVVYSARKWARLALAGNPTVLLLLFVPDEEVVYRDAAGAELVENAHRFVSRLAAQRFLGYLRSQRAAMTGSAGAHTNRPELVAEHGYDTKFAMHALRLGVQGVELLTTGRITLPVPQPARERLRAVRRGEVPLEQVVRAVAAAEERLEALRQSPAVPAEPDRAWVDDWLHRAHAAYWARG
ncbi:putative nucleotidyltransferase [Kineococcus xinjiangensis]|uniref:Putative nucleotidyltransferase n=1 Tax=Kineococcus xinjiangensis TaxID=512762 RepID=A0A2S6IVH0_9ACTN|nr:nucleotidyltransferase domain-containing protein [Kineococcus xinjiangensis]PPK98354.1 putative nucleotidyltransferase [Kineococcus xinjiangensis]